MRLYWGLYDEDDEALEKTAMNLIIIFLDFVVLFVASLLINMQRINMIE